MEVAHGSIKCRIAYPDIHTGISVSIVIVIFIGSGERGLSILIARGLIVEGARDLKILPRVTPAALRAATAQPVLFSSDFDRLDVLCEMLRGLREGHAMHVFQAAGLGESQRDRLLDMVVHRVVPHMQPAAVDAEMLKVIVLRDPAAGSSYDPPVFETLRAAVVLGLLCSALRSRFLTCRSSTGRVITYSCVICRGTRLVAPARRACVA